MTTETAAPEYTAPEAVRRQVHAMWAAVAAPWGEHADYVEHRAAPVTAEMIRLAGPRPGDRVLELACGAGGLGLTLAPLVAPGMVTVSDVVSQMADIAAQRAAAQGAGNVEAAVLDIEQIDRPDGDFDLVVCREGLMFAVDPARAAAEIVRVLRRPGRLVAAVWGPREHNPWLDLLVDAVSAHFGTLLPPPGMPGPFALADVHRLRQVLTGAGFEQVDVTALDLELRDESFESFWDLRTSLAGPLQARLAALPTDQAEQLKERVRAAVAPFESADGIVLPGQTLIAAARRS
jgi:SAM-dependent methyltransferase